MFEGTITALVTPFKEDASAELQVDWESFDDLIEWQIACGVSGLVINGTTGEFPTLSPEERAEAVRRAVTVVKKRVPVIAGTGTNNTALSVASTQMARELGADAALVVNPYYNKPDQEGLFEHFKAVAEKGGLPVIIYNIPGRTSVEVLPATFRRLAEVPNIVAVKQAVDSASRLMEVVEAVDGKLDLLTGECSLTHLMMSVGGRGVISASANVFPEALIAITEAGLRGDFKASCQAQVRALPGIRFIFSESNPVPAKTALQLMGKIKSDAVRLPLRAASEQTRELARKTLKAYSLL